MSRAPGRVAGARMQRGAPHRDGIAVSAFEIGLFRVQAALALHEPRLLLRRAQR
jgi:hypothetical protein